MHRFAMNSLKEGLMFMMNKGGGWPSLISDDLLQEGEGEIHCKSMHDDNRVLSHHSQSV
jgi:hypothetical protein